jgi:hypothetical protein
MSKRSLCKRNRGEETQDLNLISSLVARMHVMAAFPYLGTKAVHALHECACVAYYP